MLSLCTPYPYSTADKSTALRAGRGLSRAHAEIIDIHYRWFNAELQRRMDVHYEGMQDPAILHEVTAHFGS